MDNAAVDVAINAYICTRNERELLDLLFSARKGNRVVILHPAGGKRRGSVTAVLDLRNRLLTADTSAWNDGPDKAEIDGYAVELSGDGLIHRQLSYKTREEAEQEARRLIRWYKKHKPTWKVVLRSVDTDGNSEEIALTCPQE